MKSPSTFRKKVRPKVAGHSLSYGWRRAHCEPRHLGSLNRKASLEDVLQPTGTGDLSGSNSSVTLGAQVTFAYDDASRLTGLTQSSPGGISLVQTRGYDNANELTNIQVSNPLTSMSYLANYTYGYDAGGQLTSYQDNNNSVLTYSYDVNGELTGA
jgi:YD repeat-containing protein